MDTAAQSFELYTLRYDFRARDPFHFPRFLTGNIFRGALGSFLQSADQGAYRLLFAARSAHEKGLNTPPRPFALRCSEIDGRSFSTTEIFSLRLNLFLPDLSILAALSAALLAMSETGFGTTRSRATLLLPPEQLRHSISLDPYCARTKGLRIHFVTPTDLKVHDALGEPLAFPNLLRLAGRRLDRLRTLYGIGPVGFDWATLNNAAAQVALIDSKLQQVNVSRRGSRTGQTHSLGGFIGHADYMGDMSNFLPIFRAACFTGVGRHTAWGNGELRLEALQ